MRYLREKMVETSFVETAVDLVGLAKEASALSEKTFLLYLIEFAKLEQALA